MRKRFKFIFSQIKGVQELINSTFHNCKKIFAGLTGKLSLDEVIKDYWSWINPQQKASERDIVIFNLFMLLAMIFIDSIDNRYLDLIKFFTTAIIQSFMGSIIFSMSTRSLVVLKKEWYPLIIFTIILGAVVQYLNHTDINKFVLLLSYTSVSLSLIFYILKTVRGKNKK